MSQQRPNMQDIIRRRQQQEFVGRLDQSTFFRRNLTLPPEERTFVIAVCGQGGVGKSTLLRHYHKLAREHGAVPILTHEDHPDVPAMLGQLATQCAQQGYELKHFSERYQLYRQRRQELETDPDAPKNFAAFLGRTLVKGGLRLARSIPVAGPLIDLINEDTIVDQDGEWSAYIARKLKHNTDEVHLLQEAIAVLTTLLLTDLQHVCDHHSVVLMCDTFEQTATYLESWLLEMLDGQYGSVPVNMVIVDAIAEIDDLRDLIPEHQGIEIARDLLVQHLTRPI